ncbi:MAG: hypothetical protein ACRD4Y_11505 [Candidatus Acidiferrales bacterium]
MRRTLVLIAAVCVALMYGSTFVAAQNAPPAGDSDNSLGDIARKARPKDAKITNKRAFTDDDVKHGDPGQQVSTPQGKNAPAQKASTDNVDIAAKTPEELGFDCYGKRLWFDDTGSWKQSLWTAYSELADAAHEWNSNHTAKAMVKMTAAQTTFTETFGRCREAVLAFDKIESWKASHAGDWYAPPACTKPHCP